MSKRSLSTVESEDLKRLSEIDDNEISTDEIPEISEESWNLAVRGDLFRPLKRPVTIRLDADILAWFKAHARGRGYQTEINRVLRRYVDATERGRN